jgi:hypothetical protein
MARGLLVLGLILTVLSSGALASDPFNACPLTADVIADPEQRGCCSWHGGVCSCSGPAWCAAMGH